MDPNYAEFLNMLTLVSTGFKAKFSILPALSLLESLQIFSKLLISLLSVSEASDSILPHKLLQTLKATVSLWDLALLTRSMEPIHAHVPLDIIPQAQVALLVTQPVKPASEAQVLNVILVLLNIPGMEQLVSAVQQIVIGAPDPLA